MQITVNASPTTLTLHIEYPPISDISYNFHLHITISTQSFPSLVYTPYSTQTQLIPKQTVCLRVTPNRMYKIECVFRFDTSTMTKNIFAFAPDHQHAEQSLSPRASIREYFQEEYGPLCSSETLLKEVSGGRVVQRYILEGRNCRNIDEFLHREEKRVNRERYRRKQDMVMNGMIVFGEVYKNVEGKQFFKNDWHMGPFYSYDGNIKGLKK